MKYFLLNILLPGICAAVFVCVVLVVIAVIRTLLKPQKVSNFTPSVDPERELKYAEKLSEMVKFETETNHDPEDFEKFLGFHKVLEAQFPLLHANLEKEMLKGNLLFHWKGESSERPIVLMAHQDVVPAEGEWIHEPYSGDIADGKVWGRGAADTKCSLMAFMQAVEELLAEGYKPKQDVYLASSCSEEIGGTGGPMLVAELKRRGVKPFCVCDEGGAIITNPIGGVKGNFAMIGVLEKGQGNVCFTAKSTGGHSSYPPQNSPIARLSKLVVDIEKHNPMTADFEPEAEAMFSTICEYGPFYLRLLLGNFWLFKPLLKKLLPKISGQVAALLRTTIAFTMQSGSEGLNVLPQEAKLYVNMRFIPHQRMEESFKIMEELGKKYDCEMEIIDGRDACEPVSIKSDAYKMIVDTINEVFPGLPTCPYVMTGGTDARFYQEICDACIRFSPVVFGADQMKGMHGLNENIDTYSLPGAVDYYKVLVKNNDNLK